MVTVTISETYDLSTTKNKLGFVGIHTPTWSVINDLYPGLAVNHKFIHLDRCDVVLACASSLPADPLQIGTDSDEVAPTDMFNPILYKAVSNDSFDTVQNRILMFRNSSFPDGSIEPSGSLSLFPAVPDEFSLYYGLLADGSWKTAHPQSGLQMKGLYPIVYSVVNTFGYPPENVVSGVATQISGRSTEVLEGASGVDGQGTSGVVIGKAGRTAAYTMRGPSMRMPSIPLHGQMGATDPEIPVSYVGVILTPPAKLKEMYFRLVVRWTVTFHGVISLTQYGDRSTIQAIGGRHYGTDYTYQSSKMDTTTDFVDTASADISKVMTS